VAHLIPANLIDFLTAGPSATKVTEVSNMQTFIQGLLGSTHETFLQGSYKNDTATSDINDVDIVAIRLTTFSGVFSSQPVSSWVAWDTIFSEIEQRLRTQRTYSSWTVTRDDKCIKVRGAFDADVVPAVLIGTDSKQDPIAIYSNKRGLEIINRPRTHYLNSVAKHQATSSNYKPIVRMFKNWAQNHFGGDKSIVSSFKLEALLHGVPNDTFVGDYPAAFILAANVIRTRLAPHMSGSTVQVPSVCGSEDIMSNWDSTGLKTFGEALGLSVNHALDAYNATTRTAAESSWRRALGF